MLRIIDLFIEWAKQKNRWPLLLTLLVPAYFAFFQNYYDIEFSKVLEKGAFIWFSSVTVFFSICLYIYLSNYERIAYSRAMDLIRRGPRVSVTKPLARQTLTYDRGTGVKQTVSVVKEIALLLRDLHVHPVIVPQPKTTTLLVNERDQFVLDGVVSPLGFVVRSVIVMHKAQVQEVIQHLGRGVFSQEDLPEDRLRSTVPLERIYDFQSLLDMYVFELSIPSELSSEQRVALTRLFIRHALMTMFYRDGHPAGKRVARTMVDIGGLLSTIQNEHVAKIYKTVAFNLVTQDADVSEALQALRVANKLAPKDSTIIAMLIILSLELNYLDDAWQLIDQFEEVTSDKALLCWLKADCFMSSNQPDKAITQYEEAIALESNDAHCETIHFNAAFAYAMAKKLDSRQQGNGMIRHLEDALQFGDNPVFHILKGYGWALRGDLGQFEAEFAKAAVLMDGSTDQSRKALEPFIENWKARALRKLGQPSKIAENVLSVMGSPDESTDVANLLVLAGAELDIAGVKGDPEHLANAERYIDRMIELQPNNGEAFKYRGLIYTLRIENTADLEEKGRFGEKARGDFLKSIRLGYEIPESHAILTRLYESANDPVNAAKHRQRWFELSPTDPDAIAYQALTILDQTGDLAKAKAYLDAIEGKSKELGKVYRLIAAQAVGDANEVKNRTPILEDAKECLIKAVDLGDKEVVTYKLLAAILIELAAIYQAAGQLDKATDSYAECLKIDPTSPIANNNLAFILFDQDNHVEALQYWEQALQSLPDDADANAGKAAALRVLGKDDEAFSYYKTAVSLNHDYLDEDIMRDKYSWSDKAVGAVKVFISELKD